MLTSRVDLRARQVLELWERGVRAAPAERGDILLATLGEPPTSLGARNAALLSLRAQLFGNAQPLRSTCASCGVTTEFTIDCRVMANALLPASDVDGDKRVEADGFDITFRLPTTADVRSAATRAHGDREAFVRALLEACIVCCTHEDGIPCDADALSPLAIDALSRSMEAWEPGANVRFDLVCPECRATWSARMDCAAVVWSELQICAERLLMEVHELARAYGWNEAEVLSLSETRRAAYLQLAGVT